MKILNPRTDLDSTGPNWYTKIEPLYTDFVKASMASLEPGRNASVDEQLILFKGVILIVPTLIMGFISVRQGKGGGRAHEGGVKLREVVGGAENVEAGETTTSTRIY